MKAGLIVAAVTAALALGGTSTAAIGSRRRRRAHIRLHCSSR